MTATREHMDDDFLQGTSEEWLDALPARERKRLKEMLEVLTPEKAGEHWLVDVEAQHHSLTKKKGASAKATGQNVFARLKRQFDMFACGHPSYEQQRKTVMEALKKSRAQAVAILATALGSTIHVTAAVLAPSVVALLITLSVLGHRAYCDGIRITHEAKKNNKKS